MLRDDSTCMDSQKKYIHYVYEDKSQNNYIYTCIMLRDSTWILETSTWILEIDFERERTRERY